MLLLEYRVQKPGTVGSIHTVEYGLSCPSQFKTLTVNVWFPPPNLNVLVPTTYEDILSARQLQYFS